MQLASVQRLALHALAALCDGCHPNQTAAAEAALPLLSPILSEGSLPRGRAPGASSFMAGVLQKPFERAAGEAADGGAGGATGGDGTVAPAPADPTNLFDGARQLLLTICNGRPDLCAALPHSLLRGLLDGAMRRRDHAQCATLEAIAGVLADATEAVAAGTAPGSGPAASSACSDGWQRRCARRWRLRSAQRRDG